MWRNRSAYRQPFPETADAVFAAGQAPPAIVVYVDAWTAYGGSQFVDSPGTGRYHSYLCDEVVPWVDGRYRTLAAAGAPGDHGQVQRRVRGDDHADAAARPVRRAGHPRRGLPVRAVLHPRVRQGRASPARLRRGHLALVGRLPVADLVHQGGRPRPAHAARRVRLLLRASRTAPSSCRSTRIPGCSGRGCGSAGWTGTRSGWCRATRGAAVAAGDLDRRRDQGRMVPRRGGAGVPGGAAGGGRTRRGDPLRAVRGRPHGGSTTATRSRSPGSASASRA